MLGVNSQLFIVARRDQRAFTLIELLVVLGILTILGGFLVAVIDPPRRFADARNSRREVHLNVIINAIAENIADNRGTFNCSYGALPTSTPREMSSSGYHIAPCLVPDYLGVLPYDPSDAAAYYASTTDYNTRYTIFRNATTGQITAAAPSAELEEVISITR